MVLWCHEAMVPLYHGTMEPWYHGATYHGTMVPWHHGTMVPWCLGTKAQWKHGTMAPWNHGTRVPWYNGTMAPWYHGTMALWCHGAMVPWCHGGSSVVEATTSSPLYNLSRKAQLLLIPAYGLVSLWQVQGFSREAINYDATFSPACPPWLHAFRGSNCKNKLPRDLASSVNVEPSICW